MLKELKSESESGLTPRELADFKDEIQTQMDINLKRRIYKTTIFCTKVLLFNSLVVLLHYYFVHLVIQKLFLLYRYTLTYTRTCYFVIKIYNTLHEIDLRFIFTDLQGVFYPAGRRGVDIVKMDDRYYNYFKDKQNRECLHQMFSNDGLQIRFSKAWMFWEASLGLKITIHKGKSRSRSFQAVM